MRTSISAIFSLLFVSTIAAQESRFHNVRQLPWTRFEAREITPVRTNAPLTHEAPELDGSLDDACWRKAGRAAPFMKCDNGISLDLVSDQATEVLLCRDAKHLYLGWRFEGPAEQELAENFSSEYKYNHRNARALALLQPPDADQWYGWYFNANGGGITQSQGDAKNYEAGFEIAAQPFEGGATLEIAIPLDSPGLHVPKEGDWWRFQLGRVNRSEWTAWSNSRGQQEIPSRFGYIFFGSNDKFAEADPQVPAEVEFYGESRRYGSQRTTTQFITSLKGIPMEGRSLVFELQGKGKAHANLELAEVTEPKAAFHFDLRGLEPADYEMVAKVVDGAGKVVHTASWPFQITKEDEGAIPFPEDGVRIHVHEQSHEPNGTWPVTTGVPLPIGAVQGAAELGLFEDGERIPANIIPKATWLPSTSLSGDGPTDTGGLRWVGLSFVAQYRNGVAAEYVLKRVDPDAKPPKSPLKVTKDSKNFIIRTGASELRVKHLQFDGVEARLDMNGDRKFDSKEILIQSGGGPFIVDAEGKRYETRHRTRKGDTNIQVTIEEQGPARVVIAAKGWYHTSKGEPLCQSHTRIIAYKGLPFFRVQQRTVVTYDTRTNKLADVGFRLPMDAPVKASFGADRETVSAKVQQDAGYWSSSLHQDRHDHFRLVHESLETKDGGREVTVEEGMEGRRSDGSVYYTSHIDQRGVVVTLQDVWQKFPKELEVNNRGINLHFWPLHGRDTFTDTEELSRENVHKLYWAHEGEHLDLHIPEKYRDRLYGIRKHEFFYLSEGIDRGYGSNGIGTAISNEFVVHLKTHRYAKDKPSAPPAELIQQNPHAYADTEYACATNALERIHHQDKERFGPLERLLEEGYLAQTKFFSNTEEWGMWNYADLHTYPQPYLDYPNLHRVWLASHYRNVQTAWLMYFRSGSQRWLDWARAYSDHFMNVDMCHYAPVDNPIVGTDPEGNIRRGNLVHIAGAMMHCKGFAHWMSDLNVATHYIDPDALLWRYYLTGEYAYLDAYELWGNALSNAPIPYGANREANNTLGAIIAYYNHGWDPNMLLHIHRIGKVLNGTPFASHGSGCMWNVFWLERYYRLTQDDAIVERAREFLPAKSKSQRNDLPYSAFSALCYDVTQDKEYVRAAIDNAWGRSHGIYLNPSDPYHGWPGTVAMALGSFAYTASPRWMRAMVDADLQFKPIRPNAHLPSGGVGWTDPEGKLSRYEVLLLEPEDRDITLKFEFRSSHQVSARVFGPDGKKLAQFSVPKGYLFDEKAMKMEIPKDGKTGILRLGGGSHEPVVRLPLSNLPGEAVVVRNGGKVSIVGGIYHLSPYPGTQGLVHLRFGGRAKHKEQGPSIVRITDANGKIALDSSLAGFLDRPIVSSAIDPKQHPAPWSLTLGGRLSMSLESPGKLLMGVDVGQLEAIVGAVKSEPQ